MKVRRRTFLGFTVGAAAGTALGVPASRTLSDLVATLDPAVYPPRGPEDFVLSVCRACPGGCGVRVRRVGGRVVKLEGNPLHPVNGGRLCPKGQAALQSLYHPDRAPGPLRRIGPPGRLESFERASWKEAMEEIGNHLGSLRRDGRPESLVLVRGSSWGMAGRLASRFLQAFGSPNDLRLYRGSDAESMALFLGQGMPALPSYDLQRAEYVLSFGGALLEAWNSPVHMMRAYGEFRQGRLGRRGKLVQVESRLSITAAAADEWIPVHPGTEGILALGIAGVLVAEGLYSAEFMSERTVGFEDFRDEGGRLQKGLRSILEEDYRLERVSAQTGVPVHVILRIAREFAAARTGLTVGPRKGPILSGPLLDHLAAQWLNVLAGNLDQPGGLLVPEEIPLKPWPELPSDPRAEAGRKRPRIDGGGTREFSLMHSYPEALAEAIHSGSPYPVEVLMVLDADPAFACFAPDRFAAALERVPFVVSFATLPDDTALMADWILPQPHFLESWDLDTQPPGVSFPIVSLARPALEDPIHDVRPAAEVFLDLARRIGPEVSSAFPWPDLPSLIRSEVEGLYGARRGAIMGTRFDEAWVRLMERAGWWAPGYRSAQELWKRMQETGGWWDPLYDHGNWKRVLRTPSGRYEFRPEILMAFSERKADSSSLRNGGPAASGAETPPDGSLPLVLFEPLPVAGGRGAELPFLQEILDPGHEESWEAWVEIHPETAGSLGLRDRDWVRVESEQGFLVTKVRVTPRVVPGMAGMPVGLGRNGGGRWARGAGANPLRLLSPVRDPLSGLPDTGATRVRVSLLARGGRDRVFGRKG